MLRAPQTTLNSRVAVGDAGGAQMIGAFDRLQPDDLRRDDSRPGILDAVYLQPVHRQLVRQILRAEPDLDVFFQPLVGNAHNSLLLLYRACDGDEIGQDAERGLPRPTLALDQRQLAHRVGTQL